MRAERAESREQRTENREQRAESREQRAESREQRAERAARTLYVWASRIEMRKPLTSPLFWLSLACAL